MCIRDSVMDQTHSVQFQSLQYSLAHYTPDCDYSESYTVNLSTISSNQIGRMYKPRVQRMESFTQIQPRIRHSFAINSKPSQLQCPKHYCCCLRCGCPLPVSWRRRSSGHPAYPPGWNQLSLPADWLDTKQGMGRAIERLGWSWVPRSTVSSVVDDMWYLPPGYRGQITFHHAPIHY